MKCGGCFVATALWSQKELQWALYLGCECIALKVSESTCVSSHFCVMGAKSLPWMRGVKKGRGGNLDRVERDYLIWSYLWKGWLQSTVCSWKQKTGPKTWTFWQSRSFRGVDPKKKSLADEVRPFQRSFKESGCLWQESERLTRRFYLDFRSCRWLSWRFDLLLCNISTGGIKFSEVVPSV